MLAAKTAVLDKSGSKAVDVQGIVKNLKELVSIVENMVLEYCGEIEPSNPMQRASHSDGESHSFS